MKAFSRKFRERRNAREFERALRDAPPSMRQELYAAKAREGGFRYL